MQKAYFNISVNGKDITERIQSFEYDTSVEKDNILKLKIKPEFSLLSNDDDDIIAGNRIDFFWGWVNGKLSNKKTAIIKDLDPTFSVNEVSLTITAYDKGNSSKKNPSQTIWKNKKLSDIVKDIADRNGLSYRVKETSKVYTSLSQANRNDFEFLQDITRNEEPWNWVLFLDGEEIVLDQRDLSKNSEYLFEWGTPESKIIQFKPSYKESSKDASSVNIVTTTFNPETLQEEEKKAETTEKPLGKYTYDVNAKDLGYNKQSNGTIKRSVIDVLKPVQSFLSNNAPKETEVKEFNSDHSHVLNNNKSNSLNNNNRKTLTGSLDTIGDPLFTFGIIVTINNVGKKYSGNWYVKGVRHIINTSGDYQCKWDLQKNGSSSKLTKNPKENTTINNSVGAKNETKAEVKKVVYDENRNEVNSKGNVVSKSISKIGI